MSQIFSCSKYSHSCLNQATAAFSQNYLKKTFEILRQVILFNTVDAHGLKIQGIGQLSFCLGGQGFPDKIAMGVTNFGVHYIFINLCASMFYLLNIQTYLSCTSLLNQQFCCLLSRGGQNVEFHNIEWPKISEH